MKGNLQEALNNVNMTYKELIDIANDIVRKCTGECDAIIREASENAIEMSNELIREYMIKLALNSYTFSEIKEKSALKAECAEILRKEAYAKEFSLATGAVAQKENQATINSSDEILVEAVYNLVASLLKTKLDECHRVVDVLKTILMSRMAEAKLNNVSDAVTND